MGGASIDIIPAIDLRNGKCVRLFQGDYQQETIFNDDPLKVALQWQSMGAQRLHIVDLDGAKSGESVNLKTVESIAKAVKVPIQLGGGIRTLETIQKVLNAGVKRVILGTIAVEDPALVKAACQAIQRFNHYEYRRPGRFGRNPRLAEKHWTEGY